MDRIETAVAALIADGWTETHDGGTLDAHDLRNIARTAIYAGAAEGRLDAFARWLISLDDIGSKPYAERKEITLIRIIERAREALGEQDVTP